MEFIVGLAQLNVTSDDLDANSRTHLEFITAAQAKNVDLLLFPELSLSGANLAQYMPDVARRVESAEIAALADAAGDMDVVVGIAEDAGGGTYYNSLIYLSRGQVLHVHRKVYLVSADPINERRFFTEGQAVRAFDTRFGRMAMLNCEDAWHLGPAYLAMLDGAEFIITGASTPAGPASQLPSEELWLVLNRAYSIVLETFNLFVNRVGTEAGMEFCGSSHVIDPRGAVLAAAPIDQTALVTATVDRHAVRRQRYEVSYVRDDRATQTLRELQRIIAARAS